MAVWVLGMVPAPARGLSVEYVVGFTLLLAACVVVDRVIPLERPEASAWWQRGPALIALIVLGFLVVQLHGTLIRPALIYLLPASRAVLLYGERRGLLASLGVWLAYGLNVGVLYAWPERVGEFANYFAWFLAPYALAVVLTLGQLRQVSARQQLQRLYDELQAAQALSREAAVTEERNRLAREIHDSLAHYLTIINLQLEAAEKLPDPEQAREQVLRARRLTLECLQEVRRSVAALRARTLEELSLPRALRKLAADISETSTLHVELDVQLSDTAALDPQQTLALYRVAQEGLTNVQRHAGARRVRVSLTQPADAEIRLSIEDDGVGPPPNGDTASGDRFGLIGLRERVELLGGQLAFDRGDHGGARLSARLPLLSNGVTSRV